MGTLRIGVRVLARAAAAAFAGAFGAGERARTGGVAPRRQSTPAAASDSARMNGDTTRGQRARPTFDATIAAPSPAGPASGSFASIDDPLGAWPASVNDPW